MSRSPKTASYSLVDDDGTGEIAVIRCPEGDRATFEAAALRRMDWEGYDMAEFTLAEPEWRLYRHNPCNDGEHSWDLGRPTKPGPGNWMGAIVKVIRRAGGGE